MNFETYAYINKEVSSEMFYSLMAILHERLPCARNFYRLRKNFRENDKECLRAIQEGNLSPIRTIASPKMIRGLSLTKAESRDANSPMKNTREIRIKNGKKKSSQFLSR